jgi:tetratricopeptide (TPR) repeat protein
LSGSRKERPRAISGAVGGPSTGAGLNYQISYAVLRALRLFPEVLTFPLRNPYIRVEPRAITGREVTRWDLGFEDPWELAEAKLNPSGDDLNEWLERATKHGISGSARFVLVLGKLATRRLVALKKLIRISEEAQNDERQFRALVDLEAVPDFAELLPKLGEHPSDLLRRMKLVDLPEHILSEQVLFYSKMLSGEEEAPSLRELLFSRFSEAIPVRATLYVRDLIRVAAERGITLNAHPSVDVPGLPSDVREAILILRECPLPVPVEVLTKTLGTSEQELRTKLDEAQVSSAIAMAGAEWKLVPLPLPLAHADAALCARGLKAILAFVDVHRYEAVAGRQARNAIALARNCAVAHPDAVARMFISLDKPLKSLGDKHLVLEAAELTVAAARKTPTRGRPEVEGEAQALICGTSWALQRIGRLEQARIVAQESLQLGEAIGWDRNTSFCEKCVGRLYRIMAEEAKDPTNKRDLLRTSIAYLESAIERFSRSPEFGPEHTEVGDCYSLLGRTYLVSGARSDARRAVRKASTLIPPSGGKDYLDLRILEGELLEAGDPDAAERCYVEVIGKRGEASDSERSEIVARAYFRRALNLVAIGKSQQAIQELRKAEDLWEMLGEDDNRARAAWKRLKLEGAIPNAALRLLSAESAAVRVAAVTSHQGRIAALSGKRVARRSEPGPEYWVQLIKEARARVAVESVKW